MKKKKKKTGVFYSEAMTFQKINIKYETNCHQIIFGVSIYAYNILYLINAILYALIPAMSLSCEVLDAARDFP